MRWSVNFPSATVKIEHALIVASTPSGKRQTLATSKTTTPSSSCQTLIRGCARDSTLPSSVVICARTASRPVTVGALAEGQGDVLGVVLPQAWEVLGLHHGEVVGQQVDSGVVGVG